MGYLVFLGCMFLAISPAVAIFIQILSSNAQLVILTIGSSFFWLLGILLSSIWWTIIPALRYQFWWTVFWSVLMQELARFAFYKVYSKGEEGFIRKEQTTTLTTHPDQFKASLAFGVGAALSHSLIAYVSVLWEALGPGTYYTSSCTSVSLFVMSAIFSFCFVIFHILWSIVGFEGFKQRDYKKMGSVVGCHFIASYLTVISLASCVASIVLVMLLLVAYSGYAWYAIVMRASNNRR